MLAEIRRRALLSWRAGKPVRQPVLEHRPALRLVKVTEESERAEVLVLAQVSAVLDGVRGDTSALEGNGELAGDPVSDQLADVPVDLIRLCETVGMRRKPGQSAAVPEDCEEGHPLLVSLDGERDPPLFPPASSRQR